MKKKVVVIMGGISSEREVSLNSGRSVLNAINRDKYDVHELIINDPMDVVNKMPENVDFALLILHGKYGEDGTIQSMLESMGIKYSGCDPLTSGICMDKPNSGGSSVATFKVDRKEDVYEAVRKGLEVDDIVMIEGYLPGDEYTSFILNGEVFPTIKISSPNEFFDYESKYATGDKAATEEVVYLEESLQNEINMRTKQCWDAFNCRAFVRVDFICS